MALTIPKRDWIYALIIMVALAGVGAWQYFHEPVEGAVGKPVVAQVAPQLRGVPKVTINPIHGVKVYAPIAMEKLAAIHAVPVDVAADATKTVLASSHIKASEHNQTVTTVLDQNTGDNKTYVVDDPLPLFAFENRGHIGLYGGYKLSVGKTLAPTAEMAARLEIHEDLLQIKGAHLGVTLSGDSDGSLFGGAGISYRW